MLEFRFNDPPGQRAGAVYVTRRITVV